MMKGDMGGAAAVLGAMWGIAKLRVPANVVAVVPLTENMPSGRATKPGDVVWARNGKTIEVDNTDAEGRLILADAYVGTRVVLRPFLTANSSIRINYVSTTHRLSQIVELSTLTGAMDVALGSVFAGVFTTSDILWKELETAGERAGDPFWRMPLDDRYQEQIKSDVADLKNVGVGHKTTGGHTTWSDAVARGGPLALVRLQSFSKTSWDPMKKGRRRCPLRTSVG